MSKFWKILLQKKTRDIAVKPPQLTSAEDQTTGFFLFPFFSLSLNYISFSVLPFRVCSSSSCCLFWVKDASVWKRMSSVGQQQIERHGSSSDIWSSLRYCKEGDIQIKSRRECRPHHTLSSHPMRNHPLVSIRFWYNINPQILLNSFLSFVSLIFSWWGWKKCKFFCGFLFFAVLGICGLVETVNRVSFLCWLTLSYWNGKWVVIVCSWNRF